MKARSFWLMVSILTLAFLAQLLFSLNSNNQIRYEEIGESVRNVYYFEHGLLFSGINTHLGWYLSLDLVYKIFGFSFENIQYFKLALFLVSAYCLYQLLSKIFSFKQILIPFFTIVLSPTILYFNTLKTHYGVDLLYLPICLYLLLRINFDGPKKTQFLMIGLFWGLSMFAWLSYPSFIYYLPAFLLLFVYKLIKSQLNLTRITFVSFTSFAAFLLPLILLILHVSNKQLLLHDPTTGGGLFQGAGVFDISSFGIVWQRVCMTFLGFMGLAPSYYYELNQADWSFIFPLISIITATILTTWYFKNQKGFKIILVATWAVLLINLLAIAVLSDPAGLASVRRATGILAATMVFYTLAWLVAFKVKDQLAQMSLILALLLLPVHHIIIYPINLYHLPDFSSQRETFWFDHGSTPTEGLNYYLESLKKDDLYLRGTYLDEQDFGKDYSVIFAPLAASCYFNKLKCHTIYGYNLVKKDFIPLTLDNINYTTKLTEVLK